MPEEKGIQDMIWNEINNIRKSGDDAQSLARSVVNLSCLYANLTDKIADFERAYNLKFDEIQKNNPEKPYNKIEMESKVLEEYHLLRKSQALEKAVIQTIRASNRLVDMKEKEMHLAKYQ